MPPTAVVCNFSFRRLGSLLLLVGMFFCPEGVAAQDPDLKVEISPVQSCLSPDENSFFIEVTNQGNPLERTFYQLTWSGIEEVQVKATIKLTVYSSNPILSSSRRGEFTETFKIEGHFAGEITAEISTSYDHPGLLGFWDEEPSEETLENNRDTISVLTKPLAGTFGDSQRICRYTEPESITDLGKQLGASGAEISFIWEKAAINSDDWDTIPETNSRSFQPEALKEDTKFRRTTMAIFGVDTCTSTADFIIETKTCQVASNPMMRMRLSKP